MLYCGEDGAHCGLCPGGKTACGNAVCEDCVFDMPDDVEEDLEIGTSTAAAMVRTSYSGHRRLYFFRFMFNMLIPPASIRNCTLFQQQQVAENLPVRLY